MITTREALKIYSILIEKFGGTKGVRDMKLLESALNRPFQTFDETELYRTPVEKAAAIIESIVKNHPFIDGNKRTGYVLGRLLLMNENFDFITGQSHRYQFVIQVSTGELNYEQIKEWIQVNTQGNIR